jgi:hypothetical protein
VIVQNQIDGDFVGLKHCTSVRPVRGIVMTPWARGESYFTRMLVRRVRTDGFVDPCTPRVLKTAGGSRLGARGQIGYRVIVRRMAPRSGCSPVAAMTGASATRRLPAPPRSRGINPGHDCRREGPSEALR